MELLRRAATGTRSRLQGRPTRTASFDDTARGSMSATPTSARGEPLGEALTRRRPKWVSGFDSQKEAKTARRKALGILDDGGDAFPKEITLKEFVETAWLPHLVLHDKPTAVTWAMATRSCSSTGCCPRSGTAPRPRPPTPTARPRSTR